MSTVQRLYIAMVRQNRRGDSVPHLYDTACMDCGDRDASMTGAQYGESRVNWYCLSSFDAVASATLLRREGFVAYCPQEQVTRRRGRKVSDIKRAIWPGYLFTCCEADRLGAALVLGDCMDFLRYTDASGVRGPLRLKEGSLVPIILAEMFGALDFTDKTPPQYRPAKGDRVRITAGVFRDYLARVTSVSKNVAKLEVEKGGRMTARLGEMEAA